MTTRKKAGTRETKGKKLNVKKKTLKDLEPRSGKDARGGVDPIGTPYTYVCQPIKTGDCRTVGACAPPPKKIG
jgi:hypothetical protein